MFYHRPVAVVALYKKNMAATLNFILMTQRAKKDGRYPIYLRIIKNRKASYISTNLSLYLKEWDNGKERVKANHPNSARYNSHLRALEKEYTASVLDIENNQMDISLKAIKRKLTGQDAANFTLIARELQNKYRIEGKISTSDKVASIIKKFTSYMHSEDFTF